MRAPHAPALYWDPWQGHMNLFSATFQGTCAQGVGKGGRGEAAGRGAVAATGRAPFGVSAAAGPQQRSNGQQCSRRDRRRREPQAAHSSRYTHHAAQVGAHGVQAIALNLVLVCDDQVRGVGLCVSEEAEGSKAGLSG